MPEIMLYVQSSKRIQNSIFLLGSKFFPTHWEKFLKLEGMEFLVHYIKCTELYFM